METIGQLADLDPTSNSVSVYDEQAQLFFQANEIAVAKCVAVFLTTIEEGRIYYCETSCQAPTLPKYKSFDEIIAELKKILSRKCWW